MQPILVAPLFRDLSARLVVLLRSLTPEEWRRPTVSSQRTVKDIAAHLLDGSVRRLSIQRDRHLVGPAEKEPLMVFLNRMNAEWEQATRRLSPHVVTDLVAWADAQLCELFESLPPHAPAIFPVAWAGEERSENWFDIAREYTEKWHHTQQIFEATGRPSTITERRLFHPCLDTFMRALPRTYCGVDAPPGTIVAVEITGEAGGRWAIVRGEGRWEQVSDAGAAQSTVTFSQETAWKLFTKRRSREATRAAFPDIKISGTADLGDHVLDMVSVMA